MKPSTRDEAQGKFHEVKGAIKEKMGRRQADPVKQNDGQAEKIAGKVQKKAGQVEKVLGS